MSALLTGTLIARWHFLHPKPSGAAPYSALRLQPEASVLVGGNSGLGEGREGPGSEALSAAVLLADGAAADIVMTTPADGAGTGSAVTGRGRVGCRVCCRRRYAASSAARPARIRCPVPGICLSGICLSGIYMSGVGVTAL